MAVQFALKAVIDLNDKFSGPLKRINARFAPLRASFSRVSHAAQRLSRNIGRILRPLGLIAGVAGVAATALVKSFVDSTDSLAKFLKRVEFAPDAFQELQFAAEQSGVTTEEFRKAIEKLSEKMGVLKKAGTGAIASLLKGDSAFLKQLKSASGNAEAFDLIAEKLAGMTDVQERAAVAVALFGKAGSKLLPFFAEGPRGIAAMREEARRLGIVIPAALLPASERASDAFGRLSKAIKGSTDAIVGPFLPAIEAASNRLAFWIGKNKELIRLKMNEAFIAIRDAVKGIDLESKFKNLDFKQIVGDVKAIATFAKDALESVGGLGNALLLMVGVNLIPLGSAVGALAASLFIAAAGATGLSAALIGTGLPLIFAGIALAAPLIIRHWTPIKKFFSDIFDGILRKARAVVNFFKENAGFLIPGVSTFKIAGLGLKKIREGLGFGDLGASVKSFAPSPLTVGGPSGPLASPFQFGPPIPSLLAGGAGQFKVGGDIKVEFANAPKGTRVTTSPKAGTDLTTDMGINLRGSEGAL